MPPNDIYEVYRYLESLHIPYSENWVLKSVIHFKSLNPQISRSELCSAVYEEWLCVNLREFKIASLPSDLLSHDKITLSGIYAVQVESMIDSARSCYSELHRIQNTNVNNEVIETPNEDTGSTRRCLTFVLCDGVQEIEAMEYQHLSSISFNNPKCRPGFKIIIKGPVICRKGMLLLTEQNLHVYGGKIDDLCATNNLQTLLLRKLNLKTNSMKDTPGETPKQKIEEENVPGIITASQNTESGTIYDGSHSECNFAEMDEVDAFLSQNDILTNLSVEPSTSDGKFNRISFKENVNVMENNTRRHRADELGTCKGMISKKSHTLFERVNDANFNTKENILQNKRARIEAGSDYCSGINEEFMVPLESTCFEENIHMEDVFHSTNNDLDVISNRNFIQAGTISQSNITSSSTKSIIERNLCVTSNSSPGNGFKLPRIINSHPYLYLKQALEINLNEPSIFLVKAIILTLKSKISIKNDKFALKACISDGSYSVEVNFSSKILEEILEYSPCEIISLVKEKNKNSVITERLKTIFFSAQQKLLSMNCLMEVKFFNDGSIPLIIGLQDIQLKHLKELQERAI